MSVVHCPTINLTYMNFPEVPRMLREGINVALGSDGGAFTNLDLFEQVRIALAGHVAYYGAPFFDHAVVTADDLLRMATANGAKAILEDRLGILRESYKADVITVDVVESHCAPLYGAVSLPLFCRGLTSATW